MKAMINDSRPNFPYAYGAARKYYDWLRRVVGEVEFQQTVSVVLCEFPAGEKSIQLAQAVGRAMYQLAKDNGYKKIDNGRKWLPFVVDADCGERKRKRGLWES